MTEKQLSYKKSVIKYLQDNKKIILCKTTMSQWPVTAANSVAPHHGQAASDLRGLVMCLGALHTSSAYRFQCIGSLVQSNSRSTNKFKALISENQPFRIVIGKRAPFSFFP